MTCIVKKIAAVVTCFLISTVAAQNIRKTTSTLTISDKTTKDIKFNETLYGIFNYMDTELFKTNMEMTSTSVLDPSDASKSIDGKTKLCYLNQTQAKEAIVTNFNSQCKIADKDNSTWIVALDCDNSPKYCLDTLESFRDFATSHVQAFIAISDSLLPTLDSSTEPDNPDKFKTPQLITMTGTKKGRKLSQLAYNTKDIKYDALQLDLKHVYEEHCQLLFYTMPVYVFMCLVMIISGIAWAAYTFKIFTARQFTLQKTLIAIPIAKGIFYAQEILREMTCPWIDASAVLYIEQFSQQVLSILTVICFNTWIAALMYMIAVGWTTTIMQLDRTKMSNMVFIAGAVYLSELAGTYAQTQESTQLQVVITCMQLFVNMTIAYIVVKNAHRRHLILKHMLLNHADDIPRNYKAALQLKRDQLLRFRGIAFLFFANIIGFAIFDIIGLIWFDDYSQFTSFIELAAFEFIQFNLLLWLMVIFRPRREWPEFYGIGLELLNNLLNIDNLVGNVQNHNGRRCDMLPPILTFSINNGNLFDVEFDLKTGQIIDPLDKKDFPMGSPDNYEDDCLVRKDSRLSLMSKHLLGLSDEDLEHTDFSQAALASKEHGLSSLTSKDPVLVLNPSDVTLEDFVIERALQMRGSAGQTLLQYTVPDSENEDKPDMISDETAMNNVLNEVKVAYVDRQQRLRTKLFRRSQAHKKKDSSRRASIDTQPKKRFNLFGSSKKQISSKVTADSVEPSPRDSLLRAPGIQTNYSTATRPSNNKNRYGLARNPDYLSDSEPEVDDGYQQQRLDSDVENNEAVEEQRDRERLREQMQDFMQ